MCCAVDFRRETYFITKKDRTSATTSLMSSFDHDEFDFTESSLPPAVDNRDEEWFRFSMSELPAWAQKRMVESRPSMAAHMVANQKDDTDQPVVTAPSGAWAEVPVANITNHYIVILIVIVITNIN